MHVRESKDPKEELLKKSAKHRQDLEEEVRLISERTEKVITNALIIGGTLAAAYFLMRHFSGSHSKKKKAVVPKIKLVKAKEESGETEVIEEASAPGIVTQIGTALASQATVFLLSIAKEKLMEYLESQFEKKDKNNERS
jgi:Na+/pantothenate symporter